MDSFAIITTALLAIMGLFHFYWAFGGEAGLHKALPTKDGRRLINPGRFLTLFVGIALLGSSFVAYALHFNALHSDYLLYAGWFLSLLFLMRAVGDFHAVGFFKKIRSTAFAAYDTKYFSPLCVYLSVAFALLSYRA